MTMTNADTLHVEYESTPDAYCAYYDPEGLVGRGKTTESAVLDLLDQTDEAWRKTLHEKSELNRRLNEAVSRTVYEALLQDHENLEAACQRNAKDVAVFRQRLRERMEYAGLCSDALRSILPYRDDLPSWIGAQIDAALAAGGAHEAKEKEADAAAKGAGEVVADVGRQAGQQRADALADVAAFPNPLPHSTMCNECGLVAPPQSFKQRVGQICGEHYPDGAGNVRICMGVMQPKAPDAPGWNAIGSECPDALLPDGPTCPRCGGPRAPSGVDGGSWVHFPRATPSTGSER